MPQSTTRRGWLLALLCVSPAILFGAGLLAYWLASTIEQTRGWEPLHQRAAALFAEYEERYGSLLLPDDWSLQVEALEASNRVVEAQEAEVRYLEAHRGVFGHAGRLAAAQDRLDRARQRRDLLRDVQRR